MTLYDLPLIQVRKGEAPAYVQVAQAIRTLIAVQDLRPGALLPTEKRLQDTFGVSRATVREAFALLERDHVIDRRQGKGTFVALPPLERNLIELTSFSEDMRKRGLAPASRLLRWDEHPATVPDELAGAGAGAGAVVHLTRLRLVNDQPFGMHDVYVPAAVLQQAGITAARIAGDPSFSFYACLQAVGLDIYRARERIGAHAASPDEARHLLCAEGSPLLAIRRVSHDRAGRLLEVVEAAYLPEVYPYTIELERR